jgi:hypothetical protein
LHQSAFIQSVLLNSACWNQRWVTYSLKETTAYMVGTARAQRAATTTAVSAPAMATTLVERRPAGAARIWRKDLVWVTGTPTSALPMVEAAVKDILSVWSALGVNLSVRAV